MAGTPKRPETPLDASGLRVAVVVAAFNHDITSVLLDGARDCLASHGVPDDAVEVRWVPGSFELPLAARALARTGSYQAIVALGCVIRGETPHFEYVSQAATHGLQRVALDEGVPVGFGVLTTEDHAQAEVRAGGTHGNKGFDATQSALEMAVLLREIALGRAGPGYGLRP